MKYEIRYYYWTDMRAVRIYDAEDELQALAKSDIRSWVKGEQFRIEIRELSPVASDEPKS